MIRAIALDDEPPALAVLQHYCGTHDGIELLKTFTRVEEASRYLESFPIDLLFLDIRMPALSGLEFSKRVPPGVIVIFTTAFQEYAVEGFNLDAVDYLLKPYTYERFEQAVQKAAVLLQAQRQAQPASGGHILLRVDYALVKVELERILYVEGLDDYLKIHLTEARPLVVRMTLKSLEEKLPAAAFIRVHRSYIVALNRIDAVRNKMIQIRDIEIPVGSRYEAEFIGRYRS
jgi:two-component system LytT family response regulator